MPKGKSTPEWLEMIARNRLDMMGYTAPKLEEMFEYKLAQKLRKTDEALVAWANDNGWSTGHGDTLLDMIQEMRRQDQEERHAGGQDN